MDIKPFKKAHSQEMENRTLYQQQLFQQQKDITSAIALQPFHPLQQQSFYFQDSPTEKVKEVVKKEEKPLFDMDVIDDIEDIDPKEDQKQQQSIPQQKIPNQQSFMSQQKPISASIAMEAQQFAQQYYSAKPQDNQPLHPPHQQQKPTGYHYQQIESIRPQSQPQLPHYSALTQSVMAPIDHEKQVVYQAFERYFMNPTFVKTNPVSDTYSLYYARVYCMLAEFRYLIAVTEQDNLPSGTEMKLHNLRWKSIQLRTLSKEVKAPECSYKKEHDGLFDSEIQLIKRDKTENKVMYQCTSQPLVIELLPTKKGSVHDYPDKATLETAMDTFQCVIYFE